MSFLGEFAISVTTFKIHNFVSTLIFRDPSQETELHCCIAALICRQCVKSCKMHCVKGHVKRFNSFQVFAKNLILVWRIYGVKIWQLAENCEASSNFDVISQILTSCVKFNFNVVCQILMQSSNFDAKYQSYYKIFVVLDNVFWLSTIRIMARDCEPRHALLLGQFIVIRIVWHQSSKFASRRPNINAWYLNLT